MAITWTAKKAEINGVEQVKFTVKSDAKTMGVSGVREVGVDETTTDPLVDWLKTKLGSSLVSTFENDATNLNDTPPTPI